jgi:hypothetical protein
MGRNVEGNGNRKLYGWTEEGKKENVIQESRCPDGDSNRIPPGYK